ncbi:sulfite reductase subunit beta [Ceratobasidium sp. AG-Ba]|nr:sulfite reductase subunit beta [Ceratobasidium sp. AG-Ba]
MTTRIAQAVSDTVLDAQSLSLDGAVGVSAGSDIAAHIVQHAKPESLLSVLIKPDASTIAQLVAGLVRTPVQTGAGVVVHVALDNHVDGSPLASAAPYVLRSTTSVQAHDHAMLASRLAWSAQSLVVHLYTPVEELDVDPEHVRAMVRTERRTGSPITDDVTAEFKAYATAAAETLAAVRRAQVPVHIVGHHDGHPQTVVVTTGAAPALSSTLGGRDHVRLVEVSLLRPILASKLAAAIPESATRVIVLDSPGPRSTKWSPLHLDVAETLQSRENIPAILSGTLAELDESSAHSFFDSLDSFQDGSVLGNLSPPAQLAPPHIPKHESSYTKVLEYVFGDRFVVANDPQLVTTKGPAATRPEFALGTVQAQLDTRTKLVGAVQSLLSAGSKTGISSDLHSALADWSLKREDPKACPKAANKLLELLKAENIQHPAADEILSLAEHLTLPSRWIIGSDAWSYDLGASGLHHAIASGLNINLLLLDTVPYSQRSTTDPSQRKKDAGLYAMSHGDVYVASVAVYSSYTQVVQALIEADAYPGPSIVLAYLPYESESTPALSVLQETKRAIDSGYWPLYRWDPSKPSEPFSLDSAAIKAELQEFLDQQNHLSILSNATPDLAKELVGSLGEDLKAARKKQAQAAYDALVNAMDGPPVLVLYASDGGAAEKLAKRLSQRAQARGLAARVQSLDSVPLTKLVEEEGDEARFLFVTSTAGQGEPPQNGRDTFKAINAAVARGDSSLFTKLKYAVFGMGDSHYWPRPEDAHYYNKPGKDLDARLTELGGTRIAALGLGDDQDADGPQTGYKAWEPLVWKALGVEGVSVAEAEPEPITNENIKIASRYLRGTIAEGLRDTSTGALAPSDGQLTKFHGIYEQDDRDIRDERKDAGLEPAYAFMIRVRMPGGVCSPQQWLAMSQIADEHGNGTFKLTTRQTFQFHGVIKKHLKPSIQAINRALLDTIAACGDVNRNVLCSSLPTLSHLHRQVYQFAKALSEHLLPRMTAYHEIWLDKKLVAGDAIKEQEPLYGPYYLPRKFKIAVAVPPDNDVDIFANDVGFIAIASPEGQLVGFNVTAGGGMGVTHSNKKTYPRAADVLGFCTPEQALDVARNILIVQRDNGNRKDRKNARLKYTIDRMGLDVFKAAVEAGLGWKLEVARPFKFESNIDKFGWQTGHDGKHHFTMFIENGRVQDEPGKAFKTGLQALAKAHKGTFRLTCNQHLILSEVTDERLPEMKAILAEYGLDNYAYSGLRLSSSACVAFPTCGLAMAESERYLPVLIDKVETICEENGLRNDSIVMRMTGCPNGCARPYLAEVAFVGKAPGSYVMLLGGGYYGQRLNKIYRETVSEPEILAILRPMIKRYALERHEGERFGDFVIRAGYISATTSGKEWYEGMGGEGEHQATAA